MAFLPWRTRQEQAQLGVTLASHAESLPDVIVASRPGGSLGVIVASRAKAGTSADVTLANRLKLREMFGSNGLQGLSL